LIVWFSIIILPDLPDLPDVPDLPDLPDLVEKRRALQPVAIRQAINLDGLQSDWVLQNLIINTDHQAINLFVSDNQGFKPI
jgi:hypothetical protein